MKCIICSLDSGDKLICDECREMLIFFKLEYKKMHLIKEGKDPLDAAYENMYDIMDFDEIIEEEMSGIHPPTAEEIIADIRKGMEEAKERFGMADAKIEGFLAYTDRRVRAKIDEIKSRLKP